MASEKFSLTPRRLWLEIAKGAMRICAGFVSIQILASASFMEYLMQNPQIGNKSQLFRANMARMRNADKVSG